MFNIRLDKGNGILLMKHSDSKEAISICKDTFFWSLDHSQLRPSQEYITQLTDIPKGFFISYVPKNKLFRIMTVSLCV